jgi:Icc-related predicted phosphoesterase
MRILSISDTVEPVLYGPFIKERVGAVDLILACGDLPVYYLEYIVSLLNAPLYYVHGNHDKPIRYDATLEDSGGGSFTWGNDLHGRTVNFRGLLLAGLEGCRQYNPGAPYQYTEAEVRRQTYWLGYRMRWNRLRFGRYVDVLITHAPALSIHDGQDLAHRGFASYNRFLSRYRPLLMLHGHRHVYNRQQVMETDYGKTLILNTYGYRVLDLAPAPGGGWQLVTQVHQERA